MLHMVLIVVLKSTWLVSFILLIFFMMPVFQNFSFQSINLQKIPKISQLNHLFLKYNYLYTIQHIAFSFIFISSIFWVLKLIKYFSNLIFSHLLDFEMCFSYSSTGCPKDYNMHPKFIKSFLNFTFWIVKVIMII